MFTVTGLAGHGHVCFVTDEAGAGKPVLSVAEVTAPVTEFARRAQEANADLVVVIGDCQRSDRHRRPLPALPRGAGPAHRRRGSRLALGPSPTYSNSRCAKTHG